MTAVVPTSSAAPALPDSYSGMDDLDIGDMQMPRLTIGSNADAGKFIDSLSGAKLDSVEAIILGIVKQRILWPAVMEETKSLPLCRSLDFERGMPDQGNDEFKSKFPWKESGFDQDVVLGTEDKTIPCDACPLKEWGSHPKRDKVPWCNEQIVLAVLLGPSFAPAILTVKGSQLKATKTYLSSYVRDKLPPFSNVTRITLDALTRGTVSYGVPKFEKLDDATDTAKYGEYVTTYEGMRRYVQTPRVFEDESENAASASSPAQAAAAAPAPAAASDDDDDAGAIPF